jgi:hypothetical protein
MFEIFSQGLFEGVKPMMIIRDHLIRHPDRCTHQAICVPICPLSPLLGCLSFAGDLWGLQEGGEVAGATKADRVAW